MEGRVACMVKNFIVDFGGKPGGWGWGGLLERITYPERPRHRCTSKCNIKTDIKVIRKTGCGPDSFGSELEPVADSCEHGNGILCIVDRAS